MICRGNSPIPFPISEMPVETPEWLDVCFMQKALRHLDDSIQVIDISTKPATKKGDNYTSDMIRVTVDYTHNQGGRKITKKTSVIVKIAPINDGMRKDLVSSFHLYNLFFLMVEYSRGQKSCLSVFQWACELFRQTRCENHEQSAWHANAQKTIDQTMAAKFHD